DPSSTQPPQQRPRKAAFIQLHRADVPGRGWRRRARPGGVEGTNPADFEAAGDDDRSPASRQ
ncbi:hypothetical protein P7K49_010076, partial [Saguinus oedipus]